MSEQLPCAVVTGGASGIGLGAVEFLVEKGRRVVMLDADAAALSAACDRLKDAGGDVYAYELDVSSLEQTKEIAERIEKDLGPVSGLATSAGMNRPGWALDMPLEQWHAVLNVNLTGTFISCQVFARAMMERKKGSVVTVASIGGVGGIGGRINYAVSKWGVVGLSKSLAIEWGAHGIRVNCVAPGTVDTPLIRRANLPQSYWDEILGTRTPLQRMGEPVEMGSLISYLLSDEASYITGAVISADGGQSAGFVTDVTKQSHPLGL